MTTSSGAASGADLGDSSAYTESELQTALSDIFRWPRGCQRGLRQKAAWIREGLQLGHLSVQFPYLRGNPQALNFLSGSRVTINSEVFEQMRLENTSSSSSAAAPSSTPSPPVVQTAVSLPTGVKIYGAVDDLEELNFEQRDRLIFSGTEPNNTRILFLDFHQVLDRATSETTYETGKIQDANAGVVGRTVDYAADRGVKLFVFVLSYTKDRIQHILDAFESTQSIIPRLSGVSGKSAVIYSIRESLNVPGLQTLLVDDSADVLEECYQWLEDFNAVHIKLKRKRSLEGVAYRSRKFLEDAVPDLERFVGSETS